MSSRLGLGRAESCLLAAAFLGAALALYGPALRGAFVSDDFHYLVHNPWLHELSLGNALVILDPSGPATVQVVNYAPVQLLVHALAWELFGSATPGHHAVNVALHALASWLLVLLFLRHGVPRLGAVLGGAFFLVHPANVEAVAWISQLKSSASLVLSLLALLAWTTRPLAGVLLFALALLAKATAAFVLPVALLLEWAESGRVRWRFALAAAAALGTFSVAELATHQRSGAAEAELHETPLVLARTVAALGLRYLAMAATSWGASAFHEPEPARSPLDPWWLASLPIYGLLAWRIAVLVRRGRREAERRRAGLELAFWTWALVSFAPVSQILPFLYPMADRYLYFILPGLVGAALLVAHEATQGSRVPRPALVALGVVLCLGLAVRAHARAGLWRSAALLHADAAAHYPDGRVALLLRAKRAAFAGDPETALAELERAVARGYNRFDQLETDAAWDALRELPRFRTLVDGVAGRWIDSARSKARPTQAELRAVAHAHVVRREYAEALRTYEAAIAAGGPAGEEIRVEVEAVRTALASGDPSVRVRLGVSAPE